MDVLLSLEPVTARSTCFSNQEDTVKVVSASFFPVEDRHVCMSIAMLLTHLLSACCLLGTACCAIVQEEWDKWGGVPWRTQLISGHHSCASHIFTSCSWNGLWKATCQWIWYLQNMWRRWKKSLFQRSIQTRDCETMSNLVNFLSKITY